MPRLAIAVLAALVVPIAAHLGLSQSLGAHPFWAVQIGWVGAGIGVVLALLAFWLPRIWATAGFGVLALAAFAVAHLGKVRFAASFAEDQFAGQMWYFGWIAVATFLAATIVSALRADRRTETAG